MKTKTFLQIFALLFLVNTVIFVYFERSAAAFLFGLIMILCIVWSLDAGDAGDASDASDDADGE